MEDIKKIVVLSILSFIILDAPVFAFYQELVYSFNKLPRRLCFILSK